MSEISERLKALWKKVPVWGQILLLFGVLLIVLFAAQLSNFDRATLGALPSETGTQQPSTGSMILKYVLSFITVLLLIFVIAIFVFRLRGTTYGTASRKIRIVETLRITPKQAIHLIRVGDELMLIGTTDKSMNFLSKVESISLDDIDDPSAQSTLFSNLLGEKLKENVTDDDFGGLEE
jgi:flagellar biogenesis protein FliO